MKKQDSIIFTSAFVLFLFIYISICNLFIFKQKNIIALFLGLASFLIYYIVLNKDINIIFKVNEDILYIFKNFLIVIIYIIFVLTTLFISPINYSEVFIRWEHISLFHWLRFIFAFIMNFFIPGFLILDILIKQKINLYIKFILSYLVSALISPIPIFILIIFKINIYVYGAIFYIFFITVIYMLYVSSNLQRYLKMTTISSSYINFELKLLHNLLLSILILTIAFMSITINYNNYPIFGGDQWRTLREASLIIKNSKNSLSNVMSFTTQFYWFILNMSSYFVLSGLPEVNSYVLLFMLTPMTVISIFSLKSLFKEEYFNIPILASFFSFFAGLGWLLKHTDLLTTTTDIFISQNYLFYSWIVNVSLYGIPVFLMLYYIVTDKKIIDKYKYYIIILLTGIGYLTHIFETTFFIITYCLFSILNKYKLNDYKIYLSMLYGFIIVIFIDAISPLKKYVFSDRVLSHPTLNVIFCASILLITTINMKHKFHITDILYNYYDKLYKKIIIYRLYITTFIISIYIYSLFIWISTGYKYKDIFIRQVWMYQYIPWYTWTIRLGILGLFSIVFIIYIINKSITIEKIDFFIFLIIMAFLFGFLSRFFTSILYYEFRYSIFIWLSIIIFTSFSVNYLVNNVIFKIFKNNILKQNIMVFFILGILIMGGIPSTLILEENFSLQNQTISTNEFKAFSFLKESCKPKFSVLSYSSDSESKLSTFGVVRYGVNTVTTGKRQIFESNNPNLILYIFSHSNIKYIYLTTEEIQLLNKENNFIKFLINNLPIAYTNDDITILESPTITPPSEISKMGIISSDNMKYEKFSCYYPTLLSLASSNYNYTIVSNNDPYKLLYRTLILPYDPSTELIKEFNPFNIINWTIETGKGDIEILNDDEMNTSYLKTNFISSNINGFSRIINVLDSNINIKNIKFLQISMRSSVSGIVDINLLDANNNWVRWLRHINENEISFIKLSLDEYDEKGGLFNDTICKKLIIGMNNIPEEMNFEIYKYGFDQSEKELVRGELYDYMSFLDNEGNLIVFNTDYSGYFLNLIKYNESNIILINGIQMDNYTLSTNNILSNITDLKYNENMTSYDLYNSNQVAPFIIHNKINNGNLYVVNYNPFYNMYKTLNQMEKLYFFKVLINMVLKNIQTEKCTFNPPEITPYYGNSIGPIYCNGSITITSKVIYPNLYPLHIEKILSYNNTFEINNENSNITLTNIDLENITIKNIKKIELKSNELTISSTTNSLYVDFYISKKFNMTFFPDVNSYIELNGYVNGSIYSIKLTDSRIVLINCSQPISSYFISKSPSIKVIGTSSFKQISIGWPLTNFNIKGSSILISGNVLFKIINTNKILSLSHFVYDGSLKELKSEDWILENINFNDSIFSLTIIIIFIFGLLYSKFFISK